MTPAVEVALQMDDLVAFNQYYFWNSPATRRVKLYTRWGLPLAWLLIIVLFALVHWAVILIVSLFFCSLWMFRYPRFMNESVRMRVPKAYRDMQQKSLFLSKTVSLHPEYLHEYGVSGEERTNWMYVEKVVKTDQMILIFTGPTRANIIPRRCFPTQEAYEAFFHEAESLRERNAEHA